MIEYLPIILQTVVILVGVIASVRHSEHRISRCETKIENIEARLEPIPGLSRAVARIEGELHRK